jgi:hypothetical protein
MKGSCLCESVTFEVDKERLSLYQCHCSLCRKQSGTFSNAATIVSEQSYRITSGEDCISKWKKNTGFSSNFCARCGSPVPNRLQNTEYFWIPAGLLEDVGEMRIESHLFIGSKASWEQASSNAKTHEEFPGIEAHIAFLNSRNQ